MKSEGKQRNIVSFLKMQLSRGISNGTGDVNERLRSYLELERQQKGVHFKQDSEDDGLSLANGPATPREP